MIPCALLLLANGICGAAGRESVEYHLSLAITRLIV